MDYRNECNLTLVYSLSLKKKRFRPVGLRSSFSTPPQRNTKITNSVSRDVTVAMLVSLSKGMAAMLMSPTNPPGIELHSYANVSFCFG